MHAAGICPPGLVYSEGSRWHQGAAGFLNPTRDCRRAGGGELGGVATAASEAGARRGGGRGGALGGAESRQGRVIGGAAPEAVRRGLDGGAAW